MSDATLRKRKSRALEAGGLVYRYGQWVHKRHEVPFCGMVVSAMDTSRKLLREDGWSETDIRAVMPLREELE